MIIQTGMRTDIPAFYSDWFANRLREGFVLVRNPYNPQSVTRYVLDSSVVDMIGFCSKNPAPMLRYMDLLRPYGQYWFVTITPYGKDIEPNVPDADTVLDTFRNLAEIVGPDSIGWRYDPIFLNKEWTPERHIEAFRHMAKKLKGFTHTAVISFIDLYDKVKWNYPDAEEVPLSVQITRDRPVLFPNTHHSLPDHPRESSAGGLCCRIGRPRPCPPKLPGSERTHLRPAINHFFSASITIPQSSTPRARQ